MRQGGCIAFKVCGKRFEEPAEFLRKLGGGDRGVLKTLQDQVAMNPTSSELPYLNRTVRGFEAMIDYMKTGGEYEPADPEIRRLMDIELRHFGIRKFQKEHSREQEELKQHEIDEREAVNARKR